jgi:DNA repair protein RadC
MTSKNISYVADKNGNYKFPKPTPPQEIINLAISILDKDMRCSDVMSSPDITKNYLKLCLKGYEHEVFACLFLDNRHRVICFEEMFRGTIDSAQVHAREVVKDALKHNAAAVIFSHNHPSGVAEPSQSDINLTRELKKALSLVDVRVLDHLVVGDSVVSFAERGII